MGKMENRDHKEKDKSFRITPHRGNYSPTLLQGDVSVFFSLCLNVCNFNQIRIILSLFF